MKKVIGITGGIATGKSYVTSQIKLRHPVIDCDLMVHDLWANNQTLKDEAITLLGHKILNDGIIDRKIIASMIFNDENLRLKLNGLIHPLVIDAVMKRVKEVDAFLVFIDAPLLFESHLHLKCDEIICVFADEDVQLKRLVKRDCITKEEALKRIKAQMPMQDKISLSTYLIDNNGSLRETKRQIDRIVKEIEDAIKC